MPPETAEQNQEPLAPEQTLTPEQIQQQIADIEAQKAAQAAELAAQEAAEAAKDGDPEAIDFNEADPTNKSAGTPESSPTTEGLVETHKRSLKKVGALLSQRKWLDAGLELWNVVTEAMADFQDYLAQSLSRSKKAPKFAIDMAGQENYSFQKMFKNVQILGIQIVQPNGTPVTRIKSEPFIQIYSATNNVDLQRYVDALQLKIKESGKKVVTEKQLQGMATDVANEMKPDVPPVVEPPVVAEAPATTATPPTTPDPATTTVPPTTPPPTV